MKVRIEEISFGSKLIAQISLENGEKIRAVLCSKPTTGLYQLVYEGGIFPTLQPIEGDEHELKVRV